MYTCVSGFVGVDGSARDTAWCVSSIAELEDALCGGGAFVANNVIDELYAGTSGGAHPTIFGPSLCS